MAINLVRARHSITRAIAAVSERALKLGHLPGWEKVDGPVPSVSKPAAFPPAADESAESAPETSGTSSETEDPAGSESANQEEV